MRRILPGGDHEALLRLLHQARYEVLPTASIEDKVLAAVPREVTITVTASPVKGLDPTLELSERFAAHGYTVVPHIAVRLLRGEQHLAEVVDRLKAAGITEVFMPAGDADPPAGEWDAALPGLQALGRLGDPIPRAQANLARALDQCGAASFDPLAREVGELCGRTRTNDVCDAHVALVAVAAADVLYTSDPDDLRRLIAACARPGSRPTILRC